MVPTANALSMPVADGAFEHVQRLEAVRDIKAKMDPRDTFFLDKIVHILSLYPKLSPSMLQMGIGGNCSPAKWRPAFDALLQHNIIRRDVVEKMSPAGRRQTYVVISLA